MQTWLLPRSDLTPEQLRVVELPPDEHRVILGPAGSGKTQVLIHRAAHLAETYNIPSIGYRLFVFTNVIKEYIQSALEFLGLPEEVVCTFDHWCRIFYEDYVSECLPRRRGGGLDFEKIRHSVLDALKGDERIRNDFDFVLVDEGQDLPPLVYEVLLLLARHVTVFVDPQQKIFEDGASEAYILEKMKLGRRSVTLLGAYRNAPYVAYLASHFIEDEELRKEFLAQVCTEQKIRERPLCYMARSFQAEMDRLAEIVRQRQIMGERVGIIVPTNRLVHGLAKGLEARGVEVEKAIKKGVQAEVEDEFDTRVLVECDFGNDVPKIATFHMAKGLTFDSVLLPRLTDKAYGWIRGMARKRFLFVGIARATQWVYLSTVRGVEFREMGILREADKQGHLVVQDEEDVGVGEEELEEREESEEGPEEEPEDDFSVL